ncbi:uncharacterized protein LOC126409803 isoform X2 [Nymphaea colorata]|uniref:uncharacterized protein LOC126409803 isoform X2 n=1 Tax=Nymphaea colorata TaxID=210225 RepID=UPI00214E3AC0|nr:uncharacterized protein LOC126409803 isoform X2 [Nymphaea colorata]
MGREIVQRFLPPAAIAIITAMTFFFWSHQSRRARVNSERSDSDDGKDDASPPPPVREDGFQYDVFLSFRGPDTRKGFTGHLYQALKEKGIITFIDSETLEKGQNVEELYGCIERSKILVPIFSKGYADSKWCLKEIHKMGLDKLEELHLSGCENLVRCPLFSSNMTHLRTLDFGDCANMTELDPSIGHLKNLTDLNLRYSKSLKELPQEVSQLTSLTWLNLTGCHQITALPKSMSCLKQLKRLSLQQCSSLTEIPECICSFLNLEELDASHCQRIAFLPNWIGKLKSLKQLDLSWTAIEELPHSIVSLENLEMLSVAHCGKLEDVPGITQMKLLRALGLLGCRSLHDSFLERLQEVNFQNLGVFSIPGRRLLSYPQSLSFLLPKQFETGILYLHVDKSSLDNICSELDKNGGPEGEDESIRSEEYRNMDSEDESLKIEEDRNMDSEDESLKIEEDRNMDSNDSELVYKSIPTDEVIDRQPGRVVLIEITTGDAKFQFSALIEFKWHETGSEEEEFRKLPTATFGRHSELMKMARQGEFEGNDDDRRRTMMTMRVSIDGCDLLHGDLFTYAKNCVEWLDHDPIKADDNLVIVEFGRPF